MKLIRRLKQRLDAIGAKSEHRHRQVMTTDEKRRRLVFLHLKALGMGVPPTTEEVNAALEDGLLIKIVDAHRAKQGRPRLPPPRLPRVPS